MDKEKLLRNLAYTKQLNFLIGSGASMPAIPLMKSFLKYGENANSQLIQTVKEINELLMRKQPLVNGNDEYSDVEKISNVLKTYEAFIEALFSILSQSNSRQTPKCSNIFTTNYDLFFEKAINKILRYHNFVFNDGASGYFDRVLDSTNYNRLVAYKGLNDNYINEIPSINLFKSHGSVNWEKNCDRVIIRNYVVREPVIVYPTGYESQETFINNHFHEVLRAFQIELDKPQSILFVLGFSCGDKHISKMLRRALQNYEMKIFVFTHTNGREDYLQNLGLENEPSNLNIFTIDDFGEKFKPAIIDSDFEDNKFPFKLDYLTSILNDPKESEKIDESN